MIKQILNLLRLFWTETPRFPVIHCAEELNYKIYSRQHLDGKNCGRGVGHGEFVLRCLSKILDRH